MPQIPVRVVARVVALPEQVERVKAILVDLVMPTRAEKGCIQYDLLQNQSDDTEFTFVEIWQTRADLDAHLASTHLETAGHQLVGLLATGVDIRLYSTVL